MGRRKLAAVFGETGDPPPLLFPSLSQEVTSNSNVVVEDHYGHGWRHVTVGWVPNFLVLDGGERQMACGGTSNEGGEK